LEDYDIEPKTYSEAIAEPDGTFIIEYNRRNEKFTQQAHNLTVSMVFPEKYPSCLVIRWPSIVMWSVAGALVVLIVAFVIIQCTVEQIQKKRSTGKEYLQIE
jgi:hypothetical protein